MNHNIIIAKELLQKFTSTYFRYTLNVPCINSLYETKRMDQRFVYQSLKGYTPIGIWCKLIKKV